MNERSRLVRKVLYLLGIAILLVPIGMLASPGIVDAEGRLTRGGKLAHIRHDAKIGQANLGEIDPAGETMKLATLGLKGVAVNLLWHKAREAQKTENWTALSAACEQIRKLVPNYVTVWQFQAWNLSYNVSVEFDDYHDRYRWVIRGINFLREGIRYHANNPPLLWDLGWTIAQKIGRADEHVQYRRLFREDDKFHGSRPLKDRDNWLVGQEWFREAEHVVDDLGVPISGLNPNLDIGQKRGKGPLIFFSDAPKCQINYAEAMEEEGTFGEVAQRAWEKAGRMWNDYGNRDLRTTYNRDVRLNDKEKFEDLGKQSLAQLEAMLPEGEREKIRNEKIARLSERERNALNTPAEKRNAEQASLMYDVESKIKVTPNDLSDRTAEKDRSQALKLAAAAIESEETAGIIDRQRDIVNFKYWKQRCDVEQSDDALAARQAIYQAKQDFDAARIVESAKLFEEGFNRWAKVFDKYPEFLNETSVKDDLVDDIGVYERNLKQLERKLPADFPLRHVLEQEHHEHAASTAPAEEPDEAPKTEAEPQPADAAPAEQPAGETTPAKAEATPAEPSPAADK